MVAPANSNIAELAGYDTLRREVRYASRSDLHTWILLKFVSIQLRFSTQIGVLSAVFVFDLAQTQCELAGHLAQYCRKH